MGWFANQKYIFKTSMHIRVKIKSYLALFLCADSLSHSFQFKVQKHELFFVVFAKQVELKYTVIRNNGRKLTKYGKRTGYTDN